MAMASAPRSHRNEWTRAEERNGAGRDIATAHTDSCSSLLRLILFETTELYALDY